MTTDEPLRHLHQVYCTLINRDIPWTQDHLFPWECWASRFTEQDLRLVISYLQSKARKRQPVRSFVFRNFISGPNALSWFSEDLAEAKAMTRSAPPRGPRTTILAATHRPEQVRDGAQSVGQIMSEHEKMSALLKAYRESL